MSISILIALKNSKTSKAAVRFVAGLPLSPDNVAITLLHIFRKPLPNESIMQEEYAKREPTTEAFLQDAREQLIEKRFSSCNVQLEIVTGQYETITDAIIEQCKRHKYDMVVIGRGNMSKAEEFVMGDISIKLVRTLEGTGVLVVRS